MEKEIKVGVHNRFDFVRRDAKTGEILGEYKAENIILNNFWAKYLSSTSADCLKHIHFGSGTAAPVATDVKLTTWVGYKTAPAYNAAETVYDFSDFYTTGVVSVKKSVRLEDTEYNGEFISEVGYSSSTSSTTGLLTKALVKDMNGNVVSIEKKAGEVLDIFATFYVDFGRTFNDGKIYFANEEFTNYKIHAKLLCAYRSLNYSIVPKYLQCRPQPQAGYTNINTLESYLIGEAAVTFDTANKKLYIAMPNTVSSNGNIPGGIRGAYIDGVLIDLPCTGFTQPVLTKEVVGTGDGNNKDFQTKFGYIRDNSTAKVYVNDAEVSATIGFEKPYPKTNIINDLNVIDYPKFDNTGKLLQLSFPLGGGTIAGANSASQWVVAENPWYATIPIDTVKIAYMTVHASNDLTNWTQAATATGLATRSISAEHQNYRYWKFVPNTSNGKVDEVNSSVAASAKNIHLASAPAVGDTVAVTYQPDCIAKDDQHVLNNVKVTLTFNEYTPA